MSLDQSLYPNEEDVIEYPVIDVEQCVLAGRQIRLFCAGHHMDKMKAYYGSLCMEEITINILLHGFRSASAHNYSEIRVTLSEGDLILRIRDNGVSFNIKKMAQVLSNNEDPLANLGMKMIARTAKDIRYYRSWGSNVAIIRV